MEYIGIRGYRRSGKDTFTDYARYECEEIEIVSQKRKFGDALKEELSAWLAVERPEKSYNEYLRILNSDGPEKETYRKLMEFWGTDWRRAFWGQDYWTQRLDIWIAENCENTNVLFIPDVRFYKEVEYIRYHKGILIHIINPTIKEEDIGTHAAERELDDYTGWDYIINNDSDLDELDKKSRLFVRTRYY